MRLLPLEFVRPGMLLGRTVYVEGRAMLKEGATLTARLIDRLGELGFRSLYIKESPDERWDAPTRDIPELLSDETRIAAQKSLRDYMERMAKEMPVTAASLSGAVRAILDEVLANPKVVLQLTELRALNDYVFDHSVGVCAKAVLLGIHVGLNQIELRLMALGAILHDVGKIRIPDAIWNKAGKLTDEERELVKMHTVYGFEMLRRDPEIGILAAHIAYQHHERYDGKGYPRGLAGDQIHRWAQIAAVADVFDALTTDRAYRPALPLAKAIEVMEQEAGRAFHPDLVRTFLARVAPYPVGSLVRLNTGDAAEVIQINAKLPARPLVRLLARPDVQLDLSEKLDLRITGLLEPGAFPRASHGG